MGCPIVGGEEPGERSRFVDGAKSRIGAGIPRGTAVRVAPSSLLGAPQAEGNPSGELLAHNDRAPALFIRFPSPGGRVKNVALPWVAGKRLQLYLKEVPTLVAVRLRCRLLSKTYGQKLRMSYVPHPDEEIVLAPPGMPLSHI
jgi:hypothetical protein